MDSLTLILLSLAVWRVSHLLVREDGPFFIFKRLREFAGIGHDPSGKIYMVPDRFLAGVLSCVWCASIWVSGGWMVLWLLIPKIAVLAATLFSLSALAIGFDQVLSRQNPN